jgi:hypothetical protein
MYGQSRVGVVSSDHQLPAKSCAAALGVTGMHRTPENMSRGLLANFSRQCLATIVASLLVSLPAVPTANAASSRQEHESLGSLTTVGTVYVNGAPAPGEVTIFAGDTVLTSDSGNATFTMSGKGSIKLSPQTHLAFIADARYLAELTTGTVVMTSFADSTDVTLKIGNYVVAPVIQTEQSSSRIDKTANGSFVINCLDGSVGVIPVEGANGQVLRVGQSVAISPSGELGQMQEASSNPATTTPVKKSGAATNKTPYILLGVGGAAAAGIGIALAGHKSNNSVSPSSM